MPGMTSTHTAQQKMDELALRESERQREAMQELLIHACQEAMTGQTLTSTEALRALRAARK